MQAFPKQAKPTLAVTYKCASGHHSIRWWQIPIAIPSDVLCGICGWVSIIEDDERERHKRLRTGLEGHLIGEPRSARGRT